jgi:integrase
VWLRNQQVAGSDPASNWLRRKIVWVRHQHDRITSNDLEHHRTNLEIANHAIENECMANQKHGAGTIYKRGRIYWVSVWVNGHAIQQSSRSEKLSAATKLRDKLLGQKHRGEIAGGDPERIRIGKLLDDLLEHAETNLKPSTKYIWACVIEKNLRPHFGHLKAARLTTEQLKEYRRKRLVQGRTDATANRELSMLRTALHNGRKCTPPKVLTVPHFPIVPETTVRKGFLSDEQYQKLRDELPPELRPLFVTGYETGVRLGELKAVEWPQVDFETGLISLEATKNGEPRLVPLLDGDMRDLLMAARKERQERWPESPFVFSRQGQPIRDLRWAWREACKRAGVPDLHFHDLRRTAVRNMRRAGVPQVIRMKISGHKTDSMERRYNIVDGDDLTIAKALMQQRKKGST